MKLATSRISIRTFASRAKYGNNLVFLGAPGVGKGTFANRIAPKLGIPAISTGDIIRAEIKAGTPLGNQVKAYANSGKLVPDEIVSAMVRERLKQPDAQNGWILVSINNIMKTSTFTKIVPQSYLCYRYKFVSKRIVNE